MLFHVIFESIFVFHFDMTNGTDELCLVIKHFNSERKIG